MALHAQRAFTLIELMLVLSLVVVTASLAVPELGRQLSRWQMQAVAERLSHDMAAARFAAVQQRSAQYLRVQSGQTWCWSVSALPNCPCDAEQQCQTQRVAAPSRGRITLGQDTVIRFEPTADAQHMAATPLEVRSPHGEALRVQLTPLGRARVCSVDTARLGYVAC